MWCDVRCDAVWVIVFVTQHVTSLSRDGHVPVAGHAYYFLEDVYPRMTGRRPLKTPSFIQAMFPVDEPIRPAAENGFQQFVAADDVQQQHVGEQQQQQAGNGQVGERQAEQHQLQHDQAAPPVGATGDGGRPHED